MCGPVLAGAGRWPVGRVGRRVRWLRAVGGRWWPLVGVVGCAGGAGVLYARPPARACARYLYCIRVPYLKVFLKDFQKFLKKFYQKILQKLLRNFTKTYSLPPSINRTKPEDCSYGIRTKSEKVKIQKVNDNAVICPSKPRTPLSDTTTHVPCC